MLNLTALIGRVLENAFPNGAQDLDSLESAKENLDMLQDGTEILSVDGEDRVELADEYIKDYGKESFMKLLDESGDLSAAIYSAANQVVSAKAVNAAQEVVQVMIDRAREIKAPKGFRIAKIKILRLHPSSLDFFPPQNVIGNCEQYRNIEGSGNADLYRESSSAENYKVRYSIEAWLELEG